ncbi:MAG TPA: SIMPL domain-containing protein [Candidatus Dormibacteraeota bacterium]|nr:SIMPL domain-containing protein [Candidatus Dormibacteraeota bacterium]
MGTITVAGEGRITARPDLAITTLGVDVHATSLSEAMAEAAGTMERVWQALRGAGLQDADLRTVRYSVQVERPYDQKTERPSDSASYRVVNLVESRIRELNRVGPILDEAIAAGANSVIGVAFTVADAGSLESQARAAAMADARGRAEQLAQLVGAELGPVVQISEGGMVAPLPIEPRGLAPVSHSTPIEGGELAITARIQATYETA